MKNPYSNLEPDPDSQSHAGDTHGVYATLMFWKDVFVGLIPMWLMSGVGFAIMVIFFMIGMVFFNTNCSIKSSV